MNALNSSSFIWGKADDVLRDHYARGKYRDVILPMTVIRRLDAVLEQSKEDVLRMKAQLDEAGITNQDRALRLASGLCAAGGATFCAGRCGNAFSYASGQKFCRNRFSPTYRQSEQNRWMQHFSPVIRDFVIERR